MKVKCHKIKVPKDCCYISFGKGKYSYSFDGENKRNGKYFETIRNENFIMDFDKKGRIIGIELLGSKKARKPCQSISGDKK